MLRLNTTLQSALVLAALFAPGYSPALQLSHNLPATAISSPPALVRFLVFDSADAALPIEVYDFPAGQYHLSPRADRVWINAELVDELEPRPLWVELELDGAAKGERIPLATVTPGVTFAAGNNLDMDGNAITSLAQPSDPDDAATKGYVDGASISGNAATATALATNGTNCPSGQYAGGVDENGNAEGCTIDQVGTGDDLGDHTATANIQLGSHWLSGDGGSEGIQVDSGGKVGIGTAPGAATLVVGGVNGLLAKGALGNGSIPAEGKGVRFMWYPKKAALRAGVVESTQWDDGNIGDYSTAVGYDTTASGVISTAMGLRTTADGYSSTAMGSRTTASGWYSTAMGEGATASGIYSTAMGNGTTASEETSTAFGWGTTASGAYSTAMGNVTTASGGVSLAMGNRTTASGTNSTAMGYNTTAVSGYETVIGRYNTGYTPAEPEGWDLADRLFVIGNGESSPSDAMVVLKSGDTTINGETTINGKLVVSQLGGGGSQPLCLNGNNVLALCPPSSPASSSSSIRYKKEVAPLALGLETVQRLEPVTLTRTQGGDHDLGFIAEEVAPILATYNTEGTIQGVKYRQLTAVLVNAVKEQQEQIENLIETVNAQQEQIDNLRAGQ